MTLTQDIKGDIRDRLIYDPVVKGYDTNFFKTTSGAPTTSSGNLRLNAAACASYSQYLYGEYVFQVSIATTPSSGEAKHWGLRNPALTQGSMFFDISGATFTFQSYDSDNNATSTTVTWNQKGQTWEATLTSYKIIWTEKDIKAYAGGILVATHESGDNNLPLALRLSNSDSDNMDVDYIIANKIGKLLL